MSRAPPRERWSSADVEGEATCVASRARRLARVRASESAEEEEEEAREDSSTASTASRRRSDDGDGEGSRKSMGSRTASMLGSLSLRAETIDPNVPSVLQKLQKWGDYASCGDVVEGTRLVPMKTPLSRVYVDEGCVNALTMSGLMVEQRKRGREIRMIIDLTNHDCLYEDEIPSGVTRVHVRNVAKSTPSANDVRRVSEAVKTFMATARDDEYIAIHCAYGFNRTGFVICCHLVETCGTTPEEAMRRFARARPPGMKHLHFQDELLERYARRGGTSKDGDDEKWEEDAFKPSLAARVGMRRSFDSEPDFRNCDDVEDHNQTLDIELSRKHWRSNRVVAKDGSK
tara:strand:- start:522 stop:1553 length:1032 start_codon:yes stop_codon:yes gene_type:complete